MEITEELGTAIDGLYATLATYELPSFTDPCLHCHTVEQEGLLHTRPLRDLSAEDLWLYTNDALLVWGDVAVFKHFLPRIFEHLATAEKPTYSFTEPAIVISKLRHGHWRDWPQHEQSAVETFLRQLWRAILNDEQDEDSIDGIEGWLCSIAQAEDDLGSYLRFWMEKGSTQAALALSAFLLTSAVCRPGTAGRDAFWDQRDVQYEQLKQWVRRPEVGEKLHRAELSAEDSELAAEFAAARELCKPE
jgi:hypothetical protein